MKLLLTAAASYAPPRGGSTRSNLLWMDELARAGHEVRIVCPPGEEPAPARDSQRRDGIEIVRVRRLGRDHALLAGEIRRFLPDWVLVSSEDLSHSLLREAHRAAPGRIIYLAHTPQWFPFGPESWHPDTEGTAIVRQARAVITIGRHMAGYVARHTGREAEVIHPPLYGPGPWPRLADPSGLILMVNPCTVKGIGIFLGLADRFPQLRFGALAGWGTTAHDRRRLAARPNIEVIETVPHIDDVLRRSRLLLMPSLWYEGFGLIAMEAMLRGLPVIASDSGGLAEATRHAGRVVRVRPITRYQATIDDTGMPLADEPEQDLEPWAAALRELTGDEAVYEAESARARQAASFFARNIRPGAVEALLAGLRLPDKLTVLLGHNSHYWPGRGGGDISNRLLMEALAARGHRVHVVARTAEETGGSFVRAGVQVETVPLASPIQQTFSSRLESLNPDIAITSTDDPAQLLTAPALAHPAARVVHLVRATIAAPCGPDASSVSAERTSRLKKCDAVVGVSEYVAGYLRQYGGIDAIHLPISLFGEAAPPHVGGFENPFVTMVNPCATKGIDLFEALARALPDVRFAAVPGWGTTQDDLRRLRALPNVELQAHESDIAVLLKRTRVLLVPSVWAEARSRIVVEAWAHGVPVLAADIGGLPEAMCGMRETLLPVNPLAGYKAEVDENFVPVAEVPPQDAEPWRRTLERLLSDRHWYEDLAARGRAAALQYLHEATVEPFEHLLRGLRAEPKRAPSQALSPARQRLLELRARQGRAWTHPWFPTLTAAPLRLFVLPWAGAGVRPFRRWSVHLPREIGLCPVLLPGREARLAEPPFTSMEQLVRELAGEIAPFLRRPYALFGHSMGAGIAYELARELRRRGLPMPRALVVSSARSPAARRAMGPVEGLRAEEAQFAGISADTKLYGAWQPVPGVPLETPLIAYQGEADPRLSAADLKAWAEETSSAFSHRRFPGGHFYFDPDPVPFLRALATDLLS